MSLEAEVLWIHALAHSSEQSADGFVQREALKVLCTKGRRSCTRLARELVREGLWIEVPGGYTVPPGTWSRWQETAEQRVAARARGAERTARWRRRGDASRDASRDACRDAPKEKGQGKGDPYGSPPYPPLPPVDDLESELYVDDHGRLFVGRAPSEGGPMGEVDP